MKTITRFISKWRGVFFGIVSLIVLGLLFFFACKMLVNTAKAHEKDDCTFTGSWSIGKESVCYYTCNRGDKQITIDSTGTCPDEEDIEDYPYSDDTAI